MNRATIAAVFVACLSVVIGVASRENPETLVRHACLLILPLAVIVFPEALEAGFRSTFRGQTHADASPTPGVLLRVAAWGLLLILVVVHHAT
jgi:hypothetical protein